MPIQPGEHLPQLALTVVADGSSWTAADDLLAVVPRLLLFGMPGAFTPTCSQRHLPGYIGKLAEFNARGVQVYGMAVNDAHVMQAWAQSLGVPAALPLIADGNGELTRALGVAMDRTAYGMGTRTQRFALYAEDGVVKQVQIEHPGELRVSSAEAMLTSIFA